MIPLMKATFFHEYETKNALADFIRQTDRFSMGERCAGFERSFAEFHGVSEAILFNSGGSANLALMQALRNLGWLKPGDKVGFSSLTWSTNVMPLIQMGLVPVPIDCARQTLNAMSSTLLERLEQVDLKAMFLTNALGLTGDLDAIRTLCRERGILLLEDNCEALGTELASGLAGTFGLASTFSFFVAHHMSTIEGGMVLTANEELAEMLRIVRANGWDRNLNAAQQKKWRKTYGVGSELEAKYIFYDLGFNLRPTEITGFLGQAQLEHLSENVRRRQDNYFQFQEAIRENDDLLTLDTSHLTTVSSFALPVICRTPELRTQYLFNFAGAGIEVRPMIAGDIQRQPFYSKYVEQTFELPETGFIHDCGFYCGNYPELTATDIETILGCLTKTA